MRVTTRPRIGAAIAVAATAAALLAGCGSSSGGDAKTATAKAADSALTAALPQEVRDRGELTIATGSDYPPLEFRDDKNELTGFEVELVRRVAERLGVKARFVEADFDALIPGIQGRKYDLAVYGVLDKKERHAVVSFIDALNTSTSIVMRKEDAGKVGSIDDLCGLRAGVASGTAQVDDVKQASRRCVAAGRDAIEMQIYGTTQDMFLALTAKRTDAALNGTPASSYRVERTDDLALAGEPYRFLPYAMVVNKDRPELIEAVQSSLQQLMDDGQYRALIDEWHLGPGAISKATINSGK